MFLSKVKRVAFPTGKVGRKLKKGKNGKRGIGGVGNRGDVDVSERDSDTGKPYHPFKFYITSNNIRIDFKEQYRQQIQAPDLGFLSATKREGQWLNPLTNPYTKQYTHLLPTQKQIVYEKVKKADLYRNKLKVQKRMEKSQDIRAPFNTQAGREMIDGDGKGPGPGAYIDVTDPKHSSVLNSGGVYGNAYLAALKNYDSNFGSTIDRFDNPDYKNSTDTPGPGTYIRQEHYSSWGDAQLISIKGDNNE